MFKGGAARYRCKASRPSAKYWKSAVKEAEIKQRLYELRHILHAERVQSKPASAEPDQATCQPEGGAAETTLAEALDHLRLQLKYLLFDLDATKRENRYLRQLLDSRRKRPFGDQPGEWQPGE